MPENTTYPAATVPVLNVAPTPGPLVSVLHTERKMKIYGVTENELRTLTIVNAAMAALYSLGTGCFGYLLNLNADIALADKIPDATRAMLAVVQPGLLGLGGAFYLLGTVAWVMRASFISTIKRESDPQLRQAIAANRLGRLGRAWAAFWS